MVGEFGNEDVKPFKPQTLPNQKQSNKGINLVTSLTSTTKVIYSKLIKLIRKAAPIK